MRIGGTYQAAIEEGLYGAGGLEDHCSGYGEQGPVGYLRRR